MGFGIASVLWGLVFVFAMCGKPDKGTAAGPAQAVPNPPADMAKKNDDFVTGHILGQMYNQNFHHHQ